MSAAFGPWSVPLHEILRHIKGRARQYFWLTLAPHRDRKLCGFPARLNALGAWGITPHRVSGGLEMLV